MSNSRPQLGHVVLSEQQLAPRLGAHVGDNHRVWHRDEPLAAHEAVVPLMLPVEIAAERMLGPPCLPDRIDSTRPPIVLRQPLAIRERDGPALHLDRCDPRIRE